MKKILISLGILFLILILIGGSFVIYGVFVAKNYDASSRNYVDRIVPAIVSNWSSQALLKEGSPEFLQAIERDQINQLFSQCQRLGAFKSSQPAQGSAYVTMNYPKGKEITARYEKEVIFENGKTKIKVNLVQKEGDWKIFYFYIDAPVFNLETNTLLF